MKGDGFLFVEYEYAEESLEAHIKKRIDNNLMMGDKEIINILQILFYSICQYH